MQQNDTIEAAVDAIGGTRFGAIRLPDCWLNEPGEPNELRHLGRELAEFE